jgi:FKBP-type peptidyl-prolyl cis-trans isomerase FkpA
MLKLKSLALPCAWATLLALAHTATPAATGASPQSDGETLPSGVVVKHTARGSGAQPRESDTVKVHYRGTLPDGKEFDSSYKRNEAISFPLSRVVPCWMQGVQKMKVGGKATLTCPSETAYGKRGVPGVIPSDSTLIFEIELLAIEK